MAIVHVQGAHNGNVLGGGTIANVATTGIGTGNAICGAVSWDDSGGATIVSVTDNAGSPNTYTLESVIRDSGNSESVVVFSLGNVQGNPTIITATFAGTASARTILWDEYSGISQVADPRDGHGGQFQATPGTTANAITSGNISTAIDGDLIYGVTVNTGPTGTATISAGTSFALRTTDTTASCAQTNSEDRVQASHSATTPATFTQASNENAVTVVIALKPSAGSGPAPQLFAQICM